VDASGTVFALRTATQALQWTGCTPDWSVAPTLLALGEEEQGEALAFDDDGSLWTASEGGALRPLRSACDRVEAAEACADDAAACGCGTSAHPASLAATLVGSFALLRVRRRNGRRHSV
jgi:hypothetical protein